MLSGKAKMPRKIKKIAGKLKNMVKKMAKDFCNSNNRIIFAVAKAKGPVAQLNRASDYGSEGYRFESCRGHKMLGLVAQLNRASDYGSEGYRFESCRDHK